MAAAIVRPMLLLLIFLVMLPMPSSATSSSPVGINYGQVANNLPNPTASLPLLSSVNVGRVKIYDADSRLISAFANTGFELVIGLPDRCLPAMRDANAALNWIKSNVAAHMPATKIAAVTVGNEVLTSNDTSAAQNLLPAMQSLHAALTSLGLDRQVFVTTAHNLAILGPSYPPSAAAFRKDLLPYLCPLLDFHAKTGSPFFVNAYPYFAYKADPKGVSLAYALGEPNPGVTDQGSKLNYQNMLHAQVDAVYAAIAAAGGASGSAVEIRVSETGWPSDGDEDETGSTADNARKYNGNLMKMVAEGKGTPAKPDVPLWAFVFALYNENLKPGPKSERNYGLFKPDGTPAYDLGIIQMPDNSTNSPSGGGHGGGSPPDQAAGGSPSGYYSISAAAEWLLQWRGGVALMVASMVGLVVV